MQRLTRHELTGSAETAAVAELAYTSRSGELRVRRITPLLFRGEPAFTLCYADTEAAEDMERSPRVALVFSDSRLAYIGWNALSVSATARVTHDTEGEVFRDSLLHQELRQFPPDRELIGSMLLQRENWWYLPRHIVQLTGSEELRPVVRRTEPDHAVLAWESAEGISADTVRVEGWGADRIPVRSLMARELPDSSRAALFYHEFAIPDMDPRTSFLASGRLENGRLCVERREGSRSLGRRPGLIQRWRASRDLQRRCKAEIRRYEDG